MVMTTKPVLLYQRLDYDAPSQCGSESRVSYQLTSIFIKVLISHIVPVVRLGG